MGQVLAVLRGAFVLRGAVEVDRRRAIDPCGCLLGTARAAPVGGSGKGKPQGKLHAGACLVEAWPCQGPDRGASRGGGGGAPAPQQEAVTPSGNALPNPVHRRLTTGAGAGRLRPGGRCVIVGDVHGCIDELRALLAEVAFDRRAGRRLRGARACGCAWQRSAASCGDRAVPHARHLRFSSGPRQRAATFGLPWRRGATRLTWPRPAPIPPLPRPGLQPEGQPVRGGGPCDKGARVAAGGQRMKEPSPGRERLADEVTGHPGCHPTTPAPAPHTAPLKPQVLRALQALGAHCVRGNNDDKAVAAYAAWQRGEEPLDKFAFVAGLDADDVAWLAALPFSISMPEYGVVAVHAGEGARLTPGPHVSHRGGTWAAMPTASAGVGAGRLRAGADRANAAASCIEEQALPRARAGPLTP